MLNPAVLPGAPGAVRLIDLGDPGAPHGRLVRVRMVRMPVNAADLLAIDGRYAFPTDARDPLGAEGVGRVEAVGEAIDDLTPGDLVLPLTRGTWCAVRMIDRSALIGVPRDVDPAQAAMLRINPATAWLMLDALGVGAGDAIVQNAGGSTVAAWVRTFAQRRGVTVVDVVRRVDPALPEEVVDTSNLVERVRAVARAPLRGALDCVAGAASGRLVACLAPGGRMLVFGHLSGEPVTIPARLLTGGGLSVAGFSLRPAEAALGEARVRRLFEAILAAAPRGPALPIRAVLPLAEAAQAIALARTEGLGRVQLTP